MKRRAKRMAMRIVAEDNDLKTKCKLFISVRNSYVAIRVDGGEDNWAHIKLGAVKRIIQFLSDTVIEINERDMTEERDE